MTDLTSRKTLTDDYSVIADGKGTVHVQALSSGVIELVVATAEPAVKNVGHQLRQRTNATMSLTGLGANKVYARSVDEAIGTVAVTAY